MRLKIWPILMLAGTAVMARPVKHIVQRAYQEYSARKTWAECKKTVEADSPGEPIAWLTIPHCNLNTLVVDDANPERLHQHPCLEKVGRSDLIMAHRDIHFRPLEAIKTGDAIELENRADLTQTFHCTEIHIIDKEECAALIEKYAHKDRLLLLTCYPFRHIGPAPQRMLVVASESDPFRHPQG